MSATVRFVFFIVLIVNMLPTTANAQDELPTFEAAKRPQAPNYSQLTSWAAHPDKKDPADLVPKPLQGEALAVTQKVDVFFVHPTIFMGKVKGEYLWNGALEDADLNAEVDKTTIKLQASLFNAAGQIYAPRYRQAHLRSFHEPDIEEGNKALALAYGDVKKAFLYYLENNNNGRPFILAGHSQGGRHLKQLMQELVDGQALQKQLVAA